VTTSPFDHEQREAIGAIFDERMQLPVSIEVWARKDSVLVRPDREPCTHCENVMALARLVASLHPGLTVTLYDLDRHAKRAEEAGIDVPPLTVLRGRNGRDVRILGYWSGRLFPAVVDAITFLSAESTPLTEANRTTLATIEHDVQIEVQGAMYDAYSAHMLRLGAALAAETRHARFQFTEAVEFPALAARQGIDTVPVVLLDGQRYLGAWNEADFIEQVRRTAAGDTRVVARDEVLTMPYYTEADIARMATADGAPGDEPVTTPSGLILPR
jgi:hypothetical protein